MAHNTIVLVGMMGAGKTTLGRLLAERMGQPFVDVDAVIEERSGMRIAEMFRVHGEEEFRRRELETLRELASRDAPLVLAAGGGAFCRTNVRDALRGRCTSIFIRVPEEELLRRLEAAGVAERPLLADPDWRGRVLQLVRDRYPLYDEATLTLEVGDEEPATTVERLLALLGGTDDHPSD